MNTKCSEIIRRYAEGERSFSMVDLSGCDLSGSDLSGCSLSGSDLSRCDLSGSDLTRCSLSGSNLPWCNLTGATRLGCKIKHFRRWDGLYRYDVEICISEDDGCVVKMGCYTRTLAEWEKNFWNNYLEFPHDQSRRSKQRLAAFEFAVSYAENEGWL